MIKKVEEGLETSCRQLNPWGQPLAFDVVIGMLSDRNMCIFNNVIV